MKTRSLLAATLAAALLAFSFSTAFAASAGNSAGQILKLGAGARYAALGDTGAAEGGDSSAVFWNPAGLGFVERCSVFTTYTSLFESAAHGAASAACPLKNLGVVALGGQFLNYGEIESRDNTGAVDGEFSPSDQVLSASWGLSAGEHYALGVTGKLVSVKIDNQAYGNALDLGALFRFSGISFGGALKNAKGKVKINEVSETLPQTVVIGAQADFEQLTFMAAANSARDGGWVSGGAEYYFSPQSLGSPVVLRAGYSTRMKTKGNNLTFGIGIMEKSWTLDYALVPYGELGLTHQVSVSYFFLGRKGKPMDRDRITPGYVTPGPLPDRYILMPGEAAPKK